MPNKKRAQTSKAIREEPPILTDFTVGLNAAEVAQRKEAGFVNRVPKKVTKTYGQIFIDNVFSFFNIQFFAVAALMLAARLDFYYFLFAVPLVCNILIGLLFDIRARRLVDKLRLITETKATVVREGKTMAIPLNEVVLSDVMVLTAGEQISVDGILISGALSVDESAISGEPIPIEKTLGSEVLSGSYVRQGKGYLRVTRVGVATYAEGLQGAAKEFKRPKSELQRSTFRIFLAAGLTATALGIGSIVTWLVNPPSDMPINAEGFNAFMKGLSGSMIAMVPIGLYLVTSLTLAVGVINLARKKIDVQVLYALESLARVDVVCFDKTGTLTDGKLAIREFRNLSPLSDEAVQSRIVGLVKATGDANDTAKALSTQFAAPPAPMDKAVPFDSARKYSAAYRKEEGTYLLGAPDFLGYPLPKDVGPALEALAKAGFRVLAFYHANWVLTPGELPPRAELYAYVAFVDHLKEDAARTIAWFSANHVTAKVISGDNPFTVAEIARQAGLSGADKACSLEGVSDEAIPEYAKKFTVFGRVSPEQKANLIDALKASGHHVAMVGDGVNDILALKRADCSIAMASGSSAAKNVAHIIAVDNAFSALPDVVGEGRRVINNLQRVGGLFLAKTIFAVVLSLAFLIWSWANGPSYPFFTNNMYVWDGLTIGAGSFFLALQPTKEPLKGEFLPNVLKRALPGGIATILAVVVLYAISESDPGFLSSEGAKSLSVLAFSVVGFLVLGRVCWPFDAYRGSVFGGLLALAIALFFLDVYASKAPWFVYPGDPYGFLNISYAAITPLNWWAFLCALAVAVIGYFLADHYAEGWGFALAARQKV